MRMWIFKKPGRLLATDASYHASELNEKPPEGMNLISVVDHEDPIRCAEMVDEVIDHDIELMFYALSLSLGVSFGADLGDFDVRLVRKEGG